MNALALSVRLPAGRLPIKNDNDTRCSQAVTHPSTDRARCCLTSVFGRELVFSAWYGRCRWLPNSNSTTLSRSFIQLVAPRKKGRGTGEIKVDCENVLDRAQSAGDSRISALTTPHVAVAAICIPRLRAAVAVGQAAQEESERGI